MKNTIFTAAFVVIAFVANAQKQEAVDKALKVYQQSKKYNDISMVRSAIYELMVLQPEQTSWKDSLAYVYFGSNEFVSAILVANDILEKGTKDNILEVKALSEQQLGMLKEALTSYEKLFKATGKSYFLYQIASLQYQLKRFGECEMTINAMLNDVKTAEEKVTINLGKQQQQEVPMTAALLNIKGVMYKDLNNLDEAKKAFTKAAELSPEFVLPKANLKVIADEEKKVEEAPIEDASVSKKKKK